MAFPTAKLDEYIRRCTPRQLTEVSLQRIFQHIDSDAGFAILSANRAANSDRENQRLMKQLEGDIRGMGYGFIKTLGGWEETQPDGSKIVVTEPSLFVPQMEPDDAHKLCRKYGQDAVIWGDASGVYLIYKDGKRDRLGKNPTFQNIKDGFTRIRKKAAQNRSRPWTFKEMRYLPSGLTDAIGFANDLRTVLDGDNRLTAFVSEATDFLVRRK